MYLPDMCMANRQHAVCWPANNNQGTAETLTNHWQQLIEINQHINNLGCMSN
jgi:hypothetical protein